MLKKTLIKVILLNEVLKIVFLLKKAFPKKNDSRVHKHIQENAQKSHPKSGQVLKKSTQKSCLAQEWAQKNNFSPKKRSKKFFLSKRSS